MRTRFQSVLLVIVLIGFSACGSENPVGSFGDDPLSDDFTDRPGESSLDGFCTLPNDQVVSGGPGKDGIPALTDPPTFAAAEATYMAEEDRVIGLVIDGVPVAIPHNILWWHEIVNYNTSSEQLAVTYCPLTGSSIVFDRAVVGGAELGVSGLLYNNNLIMYDRNTEEALWSQMLSGAGCESSKNVSLTSIPHIEMSWAGWTDLHPNTRVISSSTGFTRNYTRYPYGNYEDLNNPDLLFRQPALDERRPPKERVLGIPARWRTGVGVPVWETGLVR